MGLVVLQCVQESCSSSPSSEPRKKPSKKHLPSRGKLMRRRRIRGRTRRKMPTKKVKNWRNKKKGDKEEKLDNMDDGEEEALVIVPAVETSPEPTPQPTPEPKQAKKEKKKDKKRIPIEEVEEIVSVQEVVEAS